MWICVYLFFGPASSFGHFSVARIMPKISRHCWLLIQLMQMMIISKSYVVCAHSTHLCNVAKFSNVIQDTLDRFCFDCCTLYGYSIRFDWVYAFDLNDCRDQSVDIVTFRQTKNTNHNELTQFFSNNEQISVLTVNNNLLFSFN